MTSSVFHNNNTNMIPSSLPSPPTRQKMSAFVLDRAPTCNRSGLISDTRSTSNNGRREDELRPFLYHQQQDQYDLPPIQHVVFMNTPNASPSPPFDSYRAGSSSPISSIASSPTPVDEEIHDDENDEMNNKQKQQQVTVNICRKGSIASLLNSDPELKQLDEEESRCNYQSHFFDNSPLPSTTSSSQSKKRTRRAQLDEQSSNKKQRKTFDCLQACQSKPIVANNNNKTVPSEATRATKGLRHFSKQVCDKVAEKGVTTYNEVADELAFDIQNSSTEKHTYDQKNIRRRVYDALNVLMAMNIITKDKKVIKWLGVPECYSSHSQEEEKQQLLLEQIKMEEARQTELTESIHSLRYQVDNKLEKQAHIRHLISRNQQQPETDLQKISLPFFMISSTLTTKNVHIDMKSDSRSAIVSFEQDTDNECTLYQDTDILKHLQLAVLL